MTKNNPSISGSMIWNLLERLGTQGAQLIVSIILARILLPEAYGVLSLVTVFINLATVVVETGFGSSIIQKKDIQKQEIDIIFTFNLSISLILCGALWLCSPLIASFYDKYDHSLLTWVIRIYALILPIGAVTSIQSSMIYRNMQFKKFFVVNILVIIGSSTVGIVLALMGAGVWALILQQLSAKIFLLSALLFAVSWKPCLNFRFGQAKSMFRFGGNILFNRLFKMLYSQMSSLVIGKHYPSDMLAYYSKGHTFPSLIATNTDYALQKVMFSAYSKVQDDMAKVRELMRKTLRLSTFLLSPLMFGLLACAENFVRVVLTDKWLPCTIYIQIFCLVSFLQPLSTTTAQALNGIGRSDLTLKVGIATKVTGIAVILASVSLGVMYIALGVLLTTVITAFIYMAVNAKIFGYRFLDQLKDLSKNIFSATAMAALTMGVGTVCRPLTPLAGLMLQVLSGGVFYFVISLLLKNQNLNYLSQKLKSFVKKP